MLARRQSIHVDERERDSVRAFSEALARLVNPCSETADLTHVTASAIVVGRRGVVLHVHKRLGIWLQPGGHIDDGEDPADAALREVEEETGLRAAHFCGFPAVAHVDVHAGPRGHTHLDLRYLVAAPDVDPSPPQGESAAVEWFSFEDAIGRSDQALRGILQSLLQVSVRAAHSDDAMAVATLDKRAHESVARPAYDMTQTIVALANETPVGFLATDQRDAISIPGPRNLTQITQLCVDSAWTGRGVGASLLNVAQQRSPDGLVAHLDRERSRASTLLQRAGFVPFDEAPDDQATGDDSRWIWRRSFSA